MMEDFTTAEISTGESSIFVRLYGSGLPIVLLHGFPQTHLMWRGVRPSFGGCSGSMPLRSRVWRIAPEARCDTRLATEHREAAAYHA
jgi:pimeloyl-ACP methyl ester carboxylesterase